SRKLALPLNDLRIGVEDFRQLAMQTHADMGGAFWEFIHQAVRLAHDEFEMRDVIALLRPDHEEFVLPHGAAMQAVAAVKHENIERRYAVLDDEIPHPVDMRRLNRRDVKAVVDPEPAAC